MTGQSKSAVWRVGMYADGWVSRSAVLDVWNGKTLELEFYLPPSEEAPDTKRAYLITASEKIEIEITRNQPTRIGPIDLSRNPSRIRLYCTDLEVSVGDARKLAMKFLNCYVDGEQVDTETVNDMQMGR